MGPDSCRANFLARTILRNVSLEADLRSQLCLVGRRLYERGLIASIEGNFSAVLEPGVILCTPAGPGKENLEPKDIIKITSDGDVIEGGGLPSSEIRIHLTAYAHRPDCKGVVHAHPPAATGFALAHRTIPENLIPEAAHVLGPVALCEFGMPGTSELSDSLLPFISSHKTFLLSNHGAMTLGASLMDACHRMESLEQVAKVIINAQLLGGAQPLPQTAYKVLKEKALHGSLT